MPIRAHWLGLDVGSSSVRALLLDSRGVVRLAARRALASRRPAPGRVIYDPESILGAATGCLHEALRKAPPGAVRQAGLACQRSTFLIWRRSDGRPLTPAYGWQSRDGLAPPSLPEARRVARRTGLRWSPHYAGPRIAALLARRPALRGLLRSGRACLGTLDAFLLYRWSRGEIFRTDPTHAQRTLLYSPSAGAWDPRLLERFGVPERCLPRLGPSVGLDLRLPGTPARLSASCGDQQAALHAVRACAPGACLINYGTGAFLLAACRAGARRPAGLLLAEAVGPSGGRALALEAPLPTAAAALDLLRAGGGRARRAASGTAAPPPLLIAATDGIGAPFWLDGIPSLLLFERLPEQAAADAAAEFSIAASVQAAIEQLPQRPARLVASGGLAERAGLLRMQADLAGRRIERARPAEWTALGAALLAAGPERPPRPRLRLEGFPPDARRRRESLRRYAAWRRGVAFLGRLGGT